MIGIDILKLKRDASEIRKSIIQMLCCSGSGHAGGSLSSADIMAVLFFNVMRHNPSDPKWPDRDRFVLSKGHAAPVLYAALAEAGYFPKFELENLRKPNSILQGHPSAADLPCIEASTGSLGQGLSISVGMALAAKLDKKSWNVYCLMGDGEQDEGSVWEAAMSASHFRLGNICAIIDVNDLQIDGWTKDVMNTHSLAKKYKSFGWRVIKVDGHNIRRLASAFNKFKKRSNKDKPTVILARTIKGKGVGFMENKAEWHGRAPSKEEADHALKELELRWRE